MRRSATLFNAARTLSASPNRAFWQIALPAARPALAGGLALVLMETLADFGVVDYFSVPTFSTGIFRTWFAFGEKVVAMKLAAVMLLLVLALVLFEKRSRRKIEHQSLAADHQQQRLILSTSMGRFVFVLCALPVLFGALIPITVLVKYAWTVGYSGYSTGIPHRSGTRQSPPQSGSRSGPLACCVQSTQRTWRPIADRRRSRHI